LRAPAPPPVSGCGLRAGQYDGPTIGIGAKSFPLYLDLAAELKLEDGVLVGACFGGWIAPEMMVRSMARFPHLVPVDPLGIKITPAHGEGWRQAVPGARLEIIPQAGDFPQWEQPEAFVERLSTFVGKND
jgi:hypothetical protein